MRLVSEGKWSENIEELDKSGYTVWRLRPDKKLGAIHRGTPQDAVKQSLKV